VKLFPTGHAPEDVSRPEIINPPHPSSNAIGWRTGGAINHATYVSSPEENYA